MRNILSYENWRLKHYMMGIMPESANYDVHDEFLLILPG